MKNNSNEMKKRNILITGGTGFIGANLTHALLDGKFKIHVLVRKSSNIWRLKNIQKKIQFHELDLMNINDDKIIKKINPEIVFHCAAYGINSKESNYSKMIKTNVHGTLNLFSILSNLNVKRIVNIGSVFEYGVKSGNRGLLETNSLNPLTFYGITKASQTNIAQYFFKLRSLPVTTLRLFTPYGRFENKGRLVSDIMFAIINNKKLVISSPKSVRDFIFIDDVVDAMIKASKTPNIEGEIFNIGAGKLKSVKKIVEICKKFTNFNKDISLLESQKRDYDISGGKGYANIQKAKKILHWKPKNSIEQGLKKSYQWYQSNYHVYN